MENYKNFYLSYFDEKLSKKTLENAKNYFYDFFKKNITEEQELARLLELKKMVSDSKDDLALIESKVEKLNNICLRNKTVTEEIEKEISILQNKNYHDFVIQAIWLKSILKYYPYEKETIEKEYGAYVYTLTAAILNYEKKNIAYYVNEMLNFADAFKDTILFSINLLGNSKCPLIKSYKINHTLQVAFESYLIEDLNTDAISAALLMDALQTSSKQEKLHKRIAKMTDTFNGKKVLEIFKKVGLSQNSKNEDWISARKQQLKKLSFPTNSSLSSLIILLISEKINLYEISKIYESFDDLYKNTHPAIYGNVYNEFMQSKKEEFWFDYAKISIEDAKEYYSNLWYAFNKVQKVPDYLIYEYENNFHTIFKEYPAA